MPDLSATNLGFITVSEDHDGYIGGYLVTNRWGRPLEFRLTSPVQPNRTHQILYGSTLKPYIYADLIGKNLVEKSSSPVDAIITDCEPLLDLRLNLGVAVAWLAPSGDAPAERWQQAGAHAIKLATGLLLCHPRFAGDAKALSAIIDPSSPMNLAEPFDRVRQALKEARKARPASRAA